MRSQHFERLAAFSLLGLFLAGAAVPAVDEPQVGQPAPDFSTIDSQGRMRHLADYRGKVVVLEWTNADCPFTRKHYESGNMQSLQSLARDHASCGCR
jgi:hypothetical protein